MDSLEYGKSYELPLEPEAFELFSERMQARKRFIAVASFIVENYEADFQIKLRTPEQLWLSEYVFIHGSELVTSKDVVFDGFPSNKGVKDYLNPVQKGLRFLIDGGLPIAVTGGRQNRVYHIPRILDANLTYIESPDVIKTLDSRYKVPADLLNRAHEKKRQVIQTIEAYRLPKLAHELDDVFPLSKRVRSKCRGVDPNLFVSDDERDIAAAKRICVVCPVADACFSFGKSGNHVGVWGGKYLSGSSKDEIE